MNKRSEATIKKLLSSKNERQIILGVEYAIKKYEAGVRAKIRNQGLSSAPDIDEVCNSVWIVLWQNADNGKYKPDGSLGGYLSSIARNLCLKFFRDKKNEKELPTDDISQFLKARPQALLDFTEVPMPHLRHLLELEQWEALEACMKTLSEENRKIYHYFYQKGYSHKQIGQELGKKDNTIKQRLWNIRNMLMKCYEKKKK